ncbi:hypothetical protein H7F33_10210 [Pedobacter sp. PAMC26386]|nr:hypothetical protein H7F33_10210 [Pedobacter sp. PAMC26386]
MPQKRGAELPGANKREFIDNADFTGKVFLYTLKNKVVKGMRFLNGKLVSSLVLAAHRTDITTMGQQGLEQEPDCSFGSFDSSNKSCTPSGTTLNEVEIHSYVPPPNFNWVFPPSNPASEAAPPPAGSVDLPIGNSGSGGTSAGLDQAFMAKIDDAKLKDCFKNVLNNLKNMDKGCIPNLVRVFAGTTPGYNWKMQDGQISANQNAVTSSSYNRTDGTVTTTFNSQNFKSGSDLAIAKTILHESAHAYLVSYFMVDQVSASKTYSEYYDAYISAKNPDMNAIQHDQVVKSFIGSIAVLLKQYGESQGYIATDQYYSDLAWGGLNETNAFKNLDPKVQARITDTLLTEQTGKDGNGNTVSPKGKLGGC